MRFSIIIDNRKDTEITGEPEDQEEIMMDVIRCNMCGKELSVRNDILMEDAIIISKSGDTSKERWRNPQDLYMRRLL